MKKYSAIISAIVLGLFVLGSVTAKAAGAGDPIVAQEISPEEAAKKYPPPAGKQYPDGILLPTGRNTAGICQSPYSTRVYDGRKIHRGGLILDEPAKKVFRRP
jgi:hypothetical protein